MERSIEWLLGWVKEYNIEPEILDRMGLGSDAVINYLMEEAFDYDESCRIYEHYSL